MRLTGTLEKMPVATSFMYGTHLLRSGGKNYALDSRTLRLDDFRGKPVTIIGKKDAAYPVDGGPPLIWVKEVLS